MSSHADVSLNEEKDGTGRKECFAVVMTWIPSVCHV